MKYKKHLPTYKYNSVFEIDYKALYKLSYRVVFFDLDNTLIENKMDTGNKELFNLLDNLKMAGFETYLISNSGSKRVKKLATALDLKYLSSARKPFAAKVKKFINSNSIDTAKIVFIGDQIMTDIRCANKLKCCSILIEPINRSNEPLGTRFNRFMEKKKYRYFNSNNCFKKIGEK